MMSLLCLCVYRNMNVIIPTHPTPPHRQLMMKEQCLCLQDSEKDDEVAVPVCVQEHERYYPTPPHPTVRLLPPFGGKQNQSLVAVSTFKNLTPASDWFWRVLLPQVIESYCRKWFLTYRRKWLNLTAASDGWAGSTWFYTWGNLQ